MSQIVGFSNTIEVDVLNITSYIELILPIGQDEPEAF